MPTGSIHFVIGPSGAGKSVLLKQVVGLLIPSEGTVEVGDIRLQGSDATQIQAVRERCQMIFQHGTLLDGFDVLENVALPLRKRFKLSRKDAAERARKALQSVDALNLQNRNPAELGLGLRKRVAVARALALEPEYLLYDEPTTGLDPVAARRMDALIRDVSQSATVTSLVVSHDMNSVNAIAKSVTFLQEGRSVFSGTPQQLQLSPDATIREFLQASTLPTHFHVNSD